MPVASHGERKIETCYWIRWEDFSISLGKVDLEETKKLAEKEAAENGMKYIIV